MAKEKQYNDRVGLGWRKELAAHTLSHLEHLDVLEVIAENYFSATQKDIQSLQFLARQIPLSIHGVAMGLASAHPVPESRLQSMARLVEKIQPESWSEHLAFVRANGIEIGHLAAPPRNQQTVESTVRNIERAIDVVGSVPHLENIATLVQPPASDMREEEWLTNILQASGAPLLLDLHNLYANAVNTGRQPLDMLRALPLEKVTSLHLSGGHWIKTPDGKSERLLDDHIHDVPAEVFDLLKFVAQHVRQDLTVIIERDGNYPGFDHLLSQINQARQAVKIGRSLQVACHEFV